MSGATLILIFEQLGAGSATKNLRIIARVSVGPKYNAITSVGPKYSFVAEVNHGG